MIVREAVAPGANVRRAGEDVAVGDVLLPRGARLGPAEIGLLASVGVEQVAGRPAGRASRSWRPAANSCRWGSLLGPGKIRNSNSFTAYGQVLAAGAEPVLLGIARDDSTRRGDSSRRRWTRRRHHERRRLGRRVRLRQAGPGGARRRAALLGRGDQARQAAGLRGARATRWSSACPAIPWRRWSASSCTFVRRSWPSRAGATSTVRTSSRRQPSRSRPRRNAPRRGAAGCCTATAAGGSRPRARRARRSCVPWRSRTGSPSSRPVPRAPLTGRAVHGAAARR